MAVQTKPYRKTRAPAVEPRKRRSEPVHHSAHPSQGSALVRLLPGFFILALVFVILLPNALAATLSAANRVMTRLPETVGVTPSNGALAGLFTPSIDYWSSHLSHWASLYNLDPNLLATIMQIESCGDDTVSSYAGAQGLFQVMPFHFASGENQLDPDTNAMRGANFLNECLGWSDGDAGMAMACYNGGPSVINRPFASWASETQRYYRWGTTIYDDARQNKDTSDSLATWLNAGGSSLCTRAANSLGISG
ncbi:MAG: transglycosylase SLT domain-containing protein [Chloroflexota bacterium]